MKKKTSLSVMEEVERLLASVEGGTLSDEEAVKIVMKRRDIKKRHEKPIFFCPSENRWQTKVLIDGAWKVKKWTKEKDLWQYLDNYYTALDAPPVRTLTTIFGEWLPLKQKAGPATASKHLWVWDTYIAGSILATVDVRKIDASLLDAWFADLCEKYHLTKRQIREIKTLINLLLDYADMKHYCDGNEARRLHRLSARAYVLPDKKKRPEEEVFLDAEASAVCASAVRMFRATGDPLYLLIPLGFHTGLRVGEGVALQFGDFQDGTLHLCRSEIKTYERGSDGKMHKRGFEIVDHLKCDKPSRDIPLTETAVQIVELIRSALEAQGLPAGSEDFLFVRPSDGSRHHVNDVGKVLAGCCIDAGVAPKSFHKIRKTYVSYLIAQGVPVPTVSRIVGHSASAITLDVYAKDVLPSDIVREKASGLLADFLF